MQLSLIEQFPEIKKCLFLDVFAKMIIDSRTQKPSLITMEGQRVPSNYKIRCLRKVIGTYPEGTVYKLDVRLVDVKKRKPYFSAVRNGSIQRALEFFDYNLKIQNGHTKQKLPKRKSAAIHRQTKNR